MPKLIIRVEKQNKLIDDAFNDLDRGGIYNKMQVKVFKAIYKQRINGLFNLMRRRLTNFRSDEGVNYFEATEEGDEDFIIAEKLKFEKFILGSEKELNGEKEYERYKADRIVTKVMRALKRGIAFPRDAAIRKALGSGRVMDFFNKSGITITWRIQL